MASNTNIETTVGTISIPDEMYKYLKVDHIKTSQDKLVNTSKDNGWKEALGAAPNTLVALGFCFIIARMSGGAFKCKGKDGLPTDLKSCITGCYDRSLKSFTTAGTKMEHVADTMEGLLGETGSLTMIEQYLGEATIAAINQDENPKALKKAMKFLEKHLKDLIQDVSVCIKNTKEVDQKFEEWLDYTGKVVEAFTGVSEECKAQGGIKRMFEHMKSLGSSKATEVTNTDLAELNQLFSKGVTDSETVQILNSSLNALSTIKDNLRRITEFINSTHDKLQSLQDKQLKKIKASAKDSDSLEEANELKIIYANMFDARVDLLIAGIQSRMYATASKRVIMPGMDKVTQLSKEDGKKNITNEVDIIASYAKTSQGQIQDVVKEVLKPRAIASC